MVRLLDEDRILIGLIPPAVARKLLRDKLATVYMRLPFILQLNRPSEARTTTLFQGEEHGNTSTTGN